MTKSRIFWDPGRTGPTALGVAAQDPFGVPV